MPARRRDGQGALTDADMDIPHVFCQACGFYIEKGVRGGLLAQCCGTSRDRSLRAPEAARDDPQHDSHELWGAASDPPQAFSIL